MRFFNLRRLYGHYVHGTKLTAVLRIGFGLERDFLPFLQSAEALRLDSREVNKDIVPTFIVGYESITLTVVEPFNSSVHNVTSYGAIEKA